MRFKIVAIILLFAVACNSPNSDPCESYGAIDLEMLNTIEAIEEKFNDDKTFIRRFRESQIYWIQYKDRHLRALYPKDFKTYRNEQGQEVFNPCKCKELARLTSIRVEELKMWIKNPPKNQEECPSTWNL